MNKQEISKEVAIQAMIQAIPHVGGSQLFILDTNKRIDFDDWSPFTRNSPKRTWTALSCAPAARLT